MKLVGGLEKEGEVEWGPWPGVIPKGIIVDFDEGDRRMGGRPKRDFVQPTREKCLGVLKRRLAGLPDEHQSENKK